MRDQTVARNYAQTLFALACRHEGPERYQRDIETLARLLDQSADFRMFLETPRIALDEKKTVVRQVFGGLLPKPLLNFLLVALDKRRQRILRAIAREYHVLVDEHLNRVRAEVTVARPLDERVLGSVTDRLTELLGRRTIAHVRVKPDIVGGVVVRAGDTIYDGSLRRRLDGMKRQLLSARLRSPAASAES